jgi:3-oxoacyl-[acyl-carrier-protein] synthase I
VEAKADEAMSGARLYFTSCGMACAVGGSVAAACAAIRANLDGFQELPYLDDDSEPIRGAPVPFVPWSDPPLERLSALLAMSVSDCIAGAPWVGTAAVPLLLGIAEPDRPGGLRVAHPAALIDDIGRRLGARFHPELSRVIASGHTSAFHALAVARGIVDSGAAPLCLVAGVDSYLNATSLLWLAEHFRLKTTTNSDGVIPGEAAACVLVEGKPRADTAAVALLGLGFGHEPAGILTSDAPLHARGLVEASRAALTEAGLGLHEIDFRISDAAGEGYAFKELALALQRLLRVRREDFPLWHPAEAIGDTGAAAGFCQLTLAIQAFRKGYAPGPRAISHGASIAGERAAAILDGRTEQMPGGRTPVQIGIR